MDKADLVSHCILSLQPLLTFHQFPQFVCHFFSFGSCVSHSALFLSIFTSVHLMLFISPDLDVPLLVFSYLSLHYSPILILRTGLGVHLISLDWDEGSYCFVTGSRQAL